MQTLTEIVAAVVVHSSAVAYSHFGVTLEAPQAEKPPAAAEKSVARTVAPKPAVKVVAPRTSALNAPLSKAAPTQGCRDRA
ncbi:MAG TPA: hypothetical protein PLV04_07830 [Phenylobacterium sp.]|uniref:Uncharacterized protein n=1 Tax=Phenylobacterium conjunctum TaxID=1298959 RepID=A0ABW3T2E8_9CAUL|nr:hypothetical protein [Phenylobacterium sp.]HQN51730.1 hypothetical protein [Phenylobacterium sp.]HQP20574.1 hypothetical protein [Phenylobacterium sp.]